MKVFVTGAKGLVGSALCPILRDRGVEVRDTDLPDGDITVPDRIPGLIGDWKPDWIVNLAAYTDVDACERSPSVAESCNGRAAGDLARIAGARGARLLQVSTDYVFDGRSRRPYAEEDATNPLSAYGRSKLLGERLVREALPPGRWLVVRGQSLYGAGAKSFPDAIRRAAGSRAEIPVVTDQVVQPTWAKDFAEALAGAMERDLAGIYHFAASGSCTWNECARAALEEAGITTARITPTTAAALGRPAPRPAWSVFDTAKIERDLGRRPREWRAMLRDYAGSAWRAA